MFGSPRQGQLVSGWLQNGHRNAVHQLNTDQLHNRRLPGQGWCETIRKPDLSIWPLSVLKFRLYNYNYSRDWSKLGFATQTATTSRRAFSKIKACSLLAVVFHVFSRSGATWSPSCLSFGPLWGNNASCEDSIISCQTLQTFTLARSLEQLSQNFSENIYSVLYCMFFCETFTK